VDNLSFGLKNIHCRIGKFLDDYDDDGDFIIMMMMEILSLQL
jgi:hypothetical protein